MSPYCRSSNDRTEAFLSGILLHGEHAGDRGMQGAPYSNQVFQKAEQLRGLFQGGSGIVEAVVVSQLSDIKWVAEVALEREIGAEDIYTGERGTPDVDGYEQTVFPGLLLRVRYAGRPDTEDPMVAIDFLGGGD